MKTMNLILCMETGLPPGKYNSLLTLLRPVKLTSSINYNAGHTYIHYNAGAG